MYQEKCREEPTKKRKLGCYASHAATRLKDGASRVTRWHGGEEQKHPWGYFLLGLLVVGVVFYAGGMFLAYNFALSNPTVLQASNAQVTTWKDGSGNVLASGAKIGGTISVTVTMPAVQVSEVAPISIVSQESGSVGVPYYVLAVEQYLYAEGVDVAKAVIKLTPSHASYATDMYNWLGSWGASMVNHWLATSPHKYLPASVPSVTYTSGETWTGSLDTRNYANGNYILYTCISWAPVMTAGNLQVVPTTSGSAYLTTTIPEPPSLAGAAWHNVGAIWLSSLLLGERPDTEGPQVVITANATSGDPPLTVEFNCTVFPGTDGCTDFGYLWDFGDGQNSTEVAPTHAFNATGYYDVKLTVTDALANSDTETIRITVGTPSPDPSLLLAAFVALALIAVAIVLFVKRR